MENEKEIEKNENDNDSNKMYEIEILDEKEEECENFILSFKIIIIGNCGVGKTCLINQAINKKFLNAYKTTVAIDYFTLIMKLDNKKIKLQIWDTCGQEAFRSLISSYYKNASLAIIVYSIDDEDSFQDINEWVKELKNLSSPDIKIIMIGNKSDLESNREVKYEDGKEVANQYKFDDFFETSAKTGDKVKELFINATRILYEDYLRYSEKSSILDPDTYELEKKRKKAKKIKKKNSGCC